MEQISGAMTNLVYRCSSATARQNATVIVRVFGSGGKLFSQRDERNVFLLASDLGLGPKCLVRGWGLGMCVRRRRCCAAATSAVRELHAEQSCPLKCHALHISLLNLMQVEYENGRVEEFLPGDNLSCDTLRQPDVSAAIAAAMARFHVRMLAGLTSLTLAQQQAQQPPQQQAGASANGQAERQQQAEQQLRPAIYDRIRQWHAAAVECGADLQAAGLAELPQEVRF